MPRQTEITERALYVLRTACESPTGEAVLSDNANDRRLLQPLLERGYATLLGDDKMVATPQGRAFVAGVDHVMRRL